MTNIVLLNNVDHGDLKVATGHGPAFGDAVNQTLVFPTEWEEAQREYPILFRRGEDGRFQSVVLLGLDRDENLFLEDGVWDGRYVPALHQRGPFSIGLQASEDGAEAEPMIHVDLDHPRIGGDAAQAVFLPHGGNTPYLEAISGVLRRIHAGVMIADAMFEAFEAHGLIQPIALEVTLSETRRYTLDGFHTIDAERMTALQGPALQSLHQRGFLQAAFWAMSSLANVARLIDRKNRRSGPLP
ncbi:SapC family protein [Sphingomonas desiccabilis]|uniref:SapC family protein n=1 Tax=Sphingomonas desiccabilis TaxID=429134 RepID=UPI0017D4215D|nr:SapC family protein [Sphingomonas desiccabilis]MBB3912370.1 hypothetical protein [Sphingomonas desiccabilis]